MTAALHGNRIAVIGASLGGLVAAAELKRRGLDPVIFERGKSAGGLFNKIDTPFGVQELGMHVVYVSEQHHEHLADIFGIDMFNVLTGTRVDIGASRNFGKTWFNSMYPCLLEHDQRDLMLAEILANPAMQAESANAGEEVVKRFGRLAGTGIVEPILEKLWLESAGNLTSKAIHCFFDLRRLVICDRQRAAALKRDARLDRIIANPDQLSPAGPVFGGRKGLTFRGKQQDMGASVNAWAGRNGVEIRYESSVVANPDGLTVNGRKVSDDFAACLVTMPVHAFAPAFGHTLDQVELSLYYFELDRVLTDEFPAYYILCHDPALKSSRVVNYDAYNPRQGMAPSIVAVEALHAVGARPDIGEIAAELAGILPGVRVQNDYLLPAALKACVPSIRNAAILDDIEQAISRDFRSGPLYFTGMRTDTGVFFSHHTIGLAYDSAVECAERLS